MSGLLADGFALHNGTEGFGVVGSSSNHPSSLKDIILLRLLAGGPICMGTVISGYGIEPYLSLNCYALVAGSLLHVIVSLVALSSHGEHRLQTAAHTFAGIWPTHTAGMALRLLIGAKA